MPDVFIVDLFIFKLTKISPYFAASSQHFYRYARIYQTHDIEYSACMLHIQHTQFTPH